MIDVDTFRWTKYGVPNLCTLFSGYFIRAFMALNESNLPPADKLMGTVLNRVEAKESVVKEFCRQESIEFVSLTESLRQGTTQGQQLYFTYDQHWTPIGHEVTANTVNRFIEEHPAIKTNY